jgi:hypothetical protein
MGWEGMKRMKEDKRSTGKVEVKRTTITLKIPRDNAFSLKKEHTHPALSLPTALRASGTIGV